MKDFLRLFAFVGLVSVSSCGDSNPPQLIIDSPSDGDVFTIGDTLRISGNVTDDMLIDSLIFFTDGLFSGSLNLATVSNLMDIDFFTELTIDSTVIMQNYRLEAKAYDNDENETTTTVDFSVR
jgi:hypothetical protein